MTMLHEPLFTIEIAVATHHSSLELQWELRLIPQCPSPLGRGAPHELAGHRIEPRFHEFSVD